MTIRGAGLLSFGGSQWTRKRLSSESDVPVVSAERFQVSMQYSQMVIVVVVKVKGAVEHRDELIGSVPLVVVDISGSSSPLASSNGGELGGDVVGEAGVHGDVQLPAVSCEQRGKQDHKVSKKNFPGSSDM